MRVWIATALFCAVVLVAACQPALTADRTQQMMQGEEVYTLNCSRCHEADGAGYRDLFPPLAGNHIVTLHDPRPLIEVVKYGRGSMPGFHNSLETEDFAAVLTYIRNTWGNQASAIAPKLIR